MMAPMANDFFEIFDNIITTVAASIRPSSLPLNELSFGSGSRRVTSIKHFQRTRCGGAPGFNPEFFEYFLHVRVARRKTERDPICLRPPIVKHDECTPHWEDSPTGFREEKRDRFKAHSSIALRHRPRGLRPPNVKDPARILVGTGAKVPASNT